MRQEGVSADVGGRQPAAPVGSVPVPGETWTRLGAEGFHAVGLAGPTAGWAAGEAGLVARFDLGVAFTLP